MGAYVRLLFPLYEHKKRTFQVNSLNIFQRFSLKFGLSGSEICYTPYKMMIFFKERLVFLAVPKTGTSAIERALSSRVSVLFRDPPGLKHTNARGFEKNYRNLFERKNLKSLETMAVMRDPLDWLGSWYRYRRRDALSGHPNSTENVSFDQFVEAYLLDVKPPFADIGSQGRFVTDDSGDLLVNHLFSYNDLPVAIEFLSNRLKVPIELNVLNKSPEKTLKLSDNLVSQVHSALHLDFQIFEALKDGPLSIS